MSLWNPIATRWGRLVAFFLLYVTEGIPLGFTATTVATQMRLQGVGAGQISTFVGTLYLPWAWKWVMGPIVDCVYSRKLGRRRAWIVGAQTLMALALSAGVFVDPVGQFRMFMGVILVVNVFGALQDVAIDALACKVLPKDERGLANGLMFAGAYGGQAVGGSLMLFLIGHDLVTFSMTFLLVPALIVAVTLLVALPIREHEVDDAVAMEPRPSAWAEIAAYPRQVWRAFAGSRNARLALLFAALPCGGYALSLALQANLSVEFGMTENEIGTLAFVSTIVSGVFCAVGGMCSDLWGRRRTLAVCVVALAVPGVVLAAFMIQEDWFMPVDMNAEDRRVASHQLMVVFWSTTIAYAVLQGFIYGIRGALFMDVVSPVVAATQFTAYMAVLNLVISYTSFWQAWTIEAYGYPVTLLCDAGAGLLCLIPLALMTHVGERKGHSESPASGS